MKIKRSNLVAYSWRKFLSTTVIPLIPKENGWNEVDGNLEIKWFEGDTLPSDDIYDRHVANLFDDVDEDINEEEDEDESDSDFELEYPSSNDEHDETSEEEDE